MGDAGEGECRECLLDMSDYECVILDTSFSHRYSVLGSIRKNATHPKSVNKCTAVIF
jgi:hypothetical protein